MTETNKSNLNSIMTAAQNAHKSASDEVKSIGMNKDLSETARVSRAETAGDRFRNTITGLRERLQKERALAEKDLNLAKAFNSQRRLANSEYQNRLMLEASFIRGMPDTMGQEDLKERLAVFFGDDLARQYLSAVIDEKSTERTRRGWEGLTASEILPDVYGVQLKAVDKLFSTIDSKLSSVSDNFIAKQIGEIEAEKNEKAAVFMNGLFSGISDYLDKLPEKIEFPGDVRLTGVDYATIPAYASGPADLEMSYSMFRKS